VERNNKIPTIVIDPDLPRLHSGPVPVPVSVVVAVVEREWEEGGD
jgi:hypothetical protein